MRKLKAYKELRLTNEIQVQYGIREYLIYTHKDQTRYK